MSDRYERARRISREYTRPPLVLIVLDAEGFDSKRLDERPRDLSERCPFVLHDVRCALIVGHQRGHAYGIGVSE